mmetsp:Transcript_113931/g.332925  ORF Transcript_113931/g.332925 Transcript_113931/m.332925 type:complete len:231 (+) Transcript_113931:760-1452(+)
MTSSRPTPRRTCSGSWTCCSRGSEPSRPRRPQTSTRPWGTLPPMHGRTSSQSGALRAILALCRCANASTDTRQWTRFTSGPLRLRSCCGLCRVRGHTCPRKPPTSPTLTCPRMWRREESGRCFGIIWPSHPHLPANRRKHRLGKQQTLLLTIGQKALPRRTVWKRQMWRVSHPSRSGGLSGARTRAGSWCARGWTWSHTSAQNGCHMAPSSGSWSSSTWSPSGSACTSSG